MAQDDTPPIAALFAVVFDQKVGYTISWNRALPDIDLDGVEYKCLPSGLHSVKQDVVYFVHGAHAGISAFVQEEADAAHRNASFVAIGALVPLSYGRLGKSWLHATHLRQLAKESVKNVEDTKSLEIYWKEHQQHETTKAGAASPSTTRRQSLPPSLDRKRKRTRSEVSTGLATDDAISSDHPALAVPELLDTFGPLIFPLYRAALLRKRILLLGTPPVQRSCNFIYMLSILSSIPQDLSDVVQPDSETLLRTQTLFNVGIHDIPFLSEQKRKARWLACTTDDILGEKHQLYDLLVSFPNTSSESVRRRWPTIRISDGVELKATQRDLRRYRLLRSGLNRIQPNRRRYTDNANDDAESSVTTSIMRASTANLLDEVKQNEPAESEVVEPVSWTAMAYNGFMWWASAGEMEAWESEEARSDRELLDDLPEVEEMVPQPRSFHDEDEEDEGGLTRTASATATLVTAYFHRLTAQIVHPLAAVVEDADDDTEEGIADSEISVSADDVRAMGLDAWSVSDRDFVKEAMELYFGREAVVDGGERRICGVRIC